MTDLPAGVTDVDLVRAASAWEDATCPGREGPYGLYDYTSYGASEPHRVRDFREPGAAGYGSVLFKSDDYSAAFAEYNRLTGIHCASAALTAGLAGRVVVPAEAEQHQVQAAADSEGSFDGGEGAFGPNGYYAHIYRAMIAAAVDGGAK